MRPIAIDPTRLPLSLALDLVLQVQPDDELFTDRLEDEYSKFGSQKEIQMLVRDVNHRRLSR